MYKEPEIQNPISVNNQIQDLRNEINELKQKIDTSKSDDSINIICFSGEWDKLFAALSIASGALALGKEVHLFFTFWAISALQNENKTTNSKKTLTQKFMNRLLPCGAKNAPLSKHNMLGLGKLCIRRLMKQKGIENIDTIYRDVIELGAHIHICETSSQLFGINCEELIGSNSINRCGVATLISNSLKGKITLFI
jgi:peroxiredoxin family protein